MTKTRTVEAYCQEPDTALEPFFGYFRLRLESVGRQFLTALQTAYNGPCWNVFANVRKTVATILKEAQTIIETGVAELPDSVRAWLGELRRQDGIRALQNETGATAHECTVAYDKAGGDFPKALESLANAKAETAAQTAA